jgi:hypothetical protein
MGVNKNISILMLFDCMRVNTGLGSHWICNSGEKKGGRYMWIDDNINGFSKNISIPYVSLVFIMYQFIYNPRVKSIKMLIFFENPLILSSIHIYLPPFFSPDELKTYDHSACDIKVKIVINFFLFERHGSKRLF